MDSPIFKEYCSYLSTYKETYGDDTIILMQVGAFYEIYAVINDDIQAGETNIHHICQNIMNIIVAKKTNKILMGGFQMPYSSKYIKLLIDQNYTVVIVSQITEKPNIIRKVTDILSPGTYLESFNLEDNNYMMSIYIEKISTWKAVGISVIDISTGKNYVYQIGENIDPNFWKDEISRIINYYSPKEFLFQVSNIDLKESDIINYWDIQNAIVRVNHYTDKSYENISYQNDLLQKVFCFETSQPPIEQLDMTYKYELCKSYIYMLQYIYEHKVDSLRNINLPELIDNIHCLSLTSNSVRQLNIVNNYSYYKGKYDSLFSICSECGFIGGRRLLKHRLLYPSINKDFLQQSYHKIDCMRDDNLYTLFKPSLRKLTDLDKSLRKMGLGTLTPKDFMNTNSSYCFVNRILDTLYKYPTLNKLYDEYSIVIETYHQFYQTISESLNTHLLYDIERPYFKSGIYPDLDDVYQTIEMTHMRLRYISKKLSSILESPTGCKIDSNDKHGHFLYCTKNRSKTLLARFKNFPDHSLNIRDDSNNVLFEIPMDSLSFKTKDSNNVIIKCDIIDELTDKLDPLMSQLKTLNQTYWTEFMDQQYKNYKDCLEKIHICISDIDVMSSIADISIKYNYCKPELVENDSSFLNAIDIRHPIVERINQDTEYVTNTVCLGKDKDGILLFGTNACGKSTLMKAVGLSVIMAQAGFYVPCKSFQYEPYTKIFTRILNNDNIFRSQSTFAIEMMELRSIFQLADENSLVLGDELCSGTETFSALSIVSQSLVELSKKKTSFIITSHLHQLTNIPVIHTIDNMSIYHLKILYNEGILSYDRKLQEGAGPAIYGLKVCEAMGLPPNFIKESNNILNDLLHQSSSIVNTKASRYNKDLFMDECKVCGSVPEETHHIKEQCTADSNNMIDHHHKNNKHNLVPLCKKCHSDVTYGNLKIYGWKQTSRGPQLDYEYITQEVVKSVIGKLTDDQINKIYQYKQLVQEGVITKIACINLIDSEYSFRPTSKQINEVFKLDR